MYRDPAPEITDSRAQARDLRARVRPTPEPNLCGGGRGSCSGSNPRAKARDLRAKAPKPKPPERQPKTPELKPETPELKPETPELKPETSELKPAPRQSQSFGDLRAQAVKDIRIPRASGLVVKTAAKQECTAEGPGFESRLVQL